MNKTAIKNFAIWARNKLIADISFQAGLAGITESGIATELPQSSGNVKFYDIGTKDPVSISGDKVQMRQRLVEAIREKETEVSYKDAFRFVVEKVAYTWFNRLIAIRFMEVNDYLPGRIRVLSSENQMKAEPDIVTSPFDSDLTFTDQEKKNILQMKDENSLDELFRFLFIRQCHELHKSLPVLFDEGKGIDRKDSYLELLLNISFTDKDGVLWHLVHDIPEDDFNVEKEGQVEIIGWLYQYYNTEPKDQVFANLKKNIKISKDNIPAATQLFTPDWIVRYMVENSLGRLWVEGHPNEDLKSNWKYYLKEAEQEPEVQKQLQEIRKGYAALKPEDIKVIDPCSGSGHILVYLFDVLMQIYESQGWTQREAAQSIVQNNLYGLDIDDRAAQLAYFAVMMKARQYDRRFLERGIIPHVYGIQESNGINREHIKLYGNGMCTIEKNNAVNQLKKILDVLHNAKEYGSILEMPELDWELLKRYTSRMDESIQITLDNVGSENTLVVMQKLVEQAQTMAQKYHLVVTNPPYMGSSGMGTQLSQYVKDYYPDSKSDLFAVFMERGNKMIVQGGYNCMVTMQSWMFLSSFEKMRINILNEKQITALLHMDNMVMHIAFGTAVTILQNTHIDGYKGTYIQIKNQDIIDDGYERPVCFPVQGNRFAQVSTDNFVMIPGSPIAYWANKEYLKICKLGMTIASFASPKTGMTTGDNNRFLRLWSEVSFEKICLTATNKEDARKSCAKWFPYLKGGDFRRWYGNNDYVVNWFNDGNEIKTNIKPNGLKAASVRSEQLYFKPLISWSAVSSGTFACRYCKGGALFDSGGSSLFINDNRLYVLALLNSKVGQYALNLTNPTINYQPGDIAGIPLCIFDVPRIEEYTQECVNISKEDWDSFETSWDFQRHPLLPPIGERCLHLSDCWTKWEQACNIRFSQMKKNEEELNRSFIKIYGLQNEITPQVTDKEITVCRAEKERDIRGFISYAIGCMFGRYSLDTSGLAYAGGEWNTSKYTSFIPDTDNCIPITDEAYFEDDIVGRFVEFIEIVYGRETLEENLDYIAKSLRCKGNSSREIIRYYFLNEFYKDHVKNYQKRPIYWLFDSGEQDGFKALVYMHRWNADTVGNLRVEYLHSMQRVYEKEIERMQDIVDNSRDNREANQASKRREKLVKQLKEVRHYDAKIAHAALSRVEIDLDDGVKVNYEKVQKGPDGKSLGILAKI